MNRDLFVIRGGQIPQDHESGLILGLEVGRFLKIMNHELGLIWDKRWADSSRSGIMNQDSFGLEVNQTLKIRIHEKDPLYL